MASPAFLPGRNKDLQDLSDALAELLGVPVRTHELRRGMDAIGQAAQFVDDPEEPEVAVHIAVTGEFTGRLLLLMRPVEARAIGRLLGKGDAPSDDILDICGEVGMIIAGRYLAVVERLVARPGIPTPPAAAVDMFAAIVESVVAYAGDEAVASLFEIAVAAPVQPIQLRLLVLREPTATA